jgi:RNA polymerase sigma-70 factor (sigma-E family)
MSTDRTSLASSGADELLSRLYQQVTEQQAARFGSGYDLEAGLDRYRTWLRTQGAADIQDIDRTITELYGAHYRPLVKLAILLVRDIPTAEEVVQDSFVALHAGLRRLKDPDRALAYLRVAVINRSRSVLRHRVIVDRHAARPDSDQPVTESDALSLIERSAVVSALQSLPARQREVVVLRFYADMSEAQIAAVMGISRGAVKSHTSRAMSSLRAELGSADE